MPLYKLRLVRDLTLVSDVVDPPKNAKNNGRDIRMTTSTSIADGRVKCLKDIVSSDICAFFSSLDRRLDVALFFVSREQLQTLRRRHMYKRIKCILDATPRCLRGKGSMP